MFIGAVMFFVSSIGSGLRLRRLGPGPLARDRRSRHRHRLGDRTRLHRRDRASTDPRRARLAAAAGDHARHLRRPAQRRRCFADGRGWGRQRPGFGLEAWRWMFLVGVVPVGGLRRSCRSRVPESPRYLIAEGRDRRGARRLRAAGPAGRPRTTRCAICRPRSRRTGRTPGVSLRGPVFGLQGDRLDRHHAVGVPAVRRHQRDLLLLDDAVAGRRVLRVRLLPDQRDHVGHQRAGDPRRDLPGRPGRPKAHPADRLGA